MKTPILLTIIFISYIVKAQDHLIQPVVLEAVDEYISTHNYKINGQGFLIVEIEQYDGQFIEFDDLDPQKVSINFVIDNYKLVIHPEYESTFLNVNPPFAFTKFKSHLIFFYTGTERLIGKHLGRSFYQKNKNYFMDLGKKEFYSVLPFYTIISYDRSEFVVEDSVMRYKSRFTFPE